MIKNLYLTQLKFWISHINNTSILHKNILLSSENNWRRVVRQWHGSRSATKEKGRHSLKSISCFGNCIVLLLLVTGFQCSNIPKSYNFTEYMQISSYQYESACAWKGTVFLKPNKNTEYMQKISHQSERATAHVLVRLPRKCTKNPFSVGCGLKYIIYQIFVASYFYDKRLIFDSIEMMIRPHYLNVSFKFDCKVTLVWHVHSSSLSTGETWQQSTELIIYKIFVVKIVKSK